MTQSSESNSRPASSVQLDIFNESGYEIPVEEDTLLRILNDISRGENVEFSEVEIAYVSEDQIIKTNREFLKKDYVTDIITFSYHQNSATEPVEGTLYCCAPRIYEQANELGENSYDEFLRVFIHGVLHLCGYKDASEDEKYVMREKENYYLKTYK